MNTSGARYKLFVARTLLDTGMIAPVRPDRALRSVRALQRWGPTPAAAYWALRSATRSGLRSATSAEP